MATLTKIGNSQGIRIPKPIIEQANLQNSEIEFKITKEGLLLRPVKKTVRENWDKNVKKFLNLQNDEAILEEMLDDSDLEEWEWWLKIERFDIVLVKLNPTVGYEIQKTRPCVVISPNEMNILKTVIIAPLTSKGFDFIFRPKVYFQEKNGLVLLDQIRAIDKSRIIKKIGKIDNQKAKEISEILVEMFI